MSKIRHITSKIAKSNLKVGDIVEFRDNSPSPHGKIPHSLTLEKRYIIHAVLKRKSQIIKVKNDQGNIVKFYANRFKKIQKR